MNPWGLPADDVAWCAALLALVLGVWAWRSQGRSVQLERALFASPASSFLLAVGLCAALGSLGYWHYYLRGGPRVIDATSYWLQAKLLARGQLEFMPDGPSASFHSRFLYATPDGGLTPLFPPGYPVLLALGALLGVPWVVGSILAALLVSATYLLAWRMFDDERTARVAALLSAGCVVLRYHTADTMSHALVALLLTGSLWAASKDDWRWRLLAGVLGGWIFATRPVTGLTIGVGWLLLGVNLRALAVCALGALPVALAFLWHQQHLTGTWGHWVQHAYYATADGPPGCIGLGFGPQIGCRIEHGEFVARYLPHGYGLLEALATTGRRLAMHVADAGNSVIAFALLPCALWLGRKRRNVWRLSGVIVAHVAAYAAFYFDGNVPGAGARMFADVLPLEHVLMGWAAAQLGCARWLPTLLLSGFAFNASAVHGALKRSQGGRPMFESKRVPDQTRLLFMDTDHGFNLAFDPDPKAKLRVARLRGDAYDRALWEHLGRPPASVYAFDLDGRLEPSVHAFVPVKDWRFEAESAWPVLGLKGGWVEPVFSLEPCVSRGRELALHPTSLAESASLELEVELWVPKPGAYRLQVLGDQSLEITRPVSAWRPEPGVCASQTSGVLSLPLGALHVSLRTRSEAKLDALELIAAP